MTLVEKDLGLWINKGLKEKSIRVLEKNLDFKFLQHFFLGRVRSLSEQMRWKFKILPSQMAGNGGAN